MHADTFEIRTIVQATPQFGFATLGEGQTRAEPIHDFLVVQFGARTEPARAPRGAATSAARHVRHGGRP